MNDPGMWFLGGFLFGCLVTMCVALMAVLPYRKRKNHKIICINSVNPESFAKYLKEQKLSMKEYFDN